MFISITFTETSIEIESSRKSEAQNLCSKYPPLEMHGEIFHFEIFKNFMKILNYFKTLF